MTTTLRGNVRVELGWTWHDMVGPHLFTDDNRLVFNQDLPDGREAGQSDAIWHLVDQSLAAGESAVFELDDLSQEIFGGTIGVRLAAVKAVLVVNKSESALLAVGGADSSQWLGPFGMLGDTLRVPPGSPLLLADVGDGWSVESGANRLKIEALGADASFDLIILGATAESASSSSSSGESSPGDSSSSSG